MRRNELVRKNKLGSGELSLILEKIRHRKITVKHFFGRSQKTLEKPIVKQLILPPLSSISKNKAKSCNTSLYTSMEIYLAGMPLKNKKTTVQQLMKMTTNAKALVSSEDIDYHRDQVINIVKTKQLGKILDC